MKSFNLYSRKNNLKKAKEGDMNIDFYRIKDYI